MTTIPYARQRAYDDDGYVTRMSDLMMRRAAAEQDAIRQQGAVSAARWAGAKTESCSTADSKMRRRRPPSSARALASLPLEVKTLFRDWLARHFPLRAARVMARVNDLRGGRDYDSEFGSRMSGKGEYSTLIAKRFARMCVKHGLHSGERFTLDTCRFRVPGRGEQLNLL